MRWCWTVYLPYLALLALVATFRSQLPAGAIVDLVQSFAFWLAAAALALAAAAIALALHLHRIWPFVRARTGPGAGRVRMYAALIAFSAIIHAAGLVGVALLWARVA